MVKAHFEPKGRLLMSIGRDLIKDSSAALVELVKNSYDADASEVEVKYVKDAGYEKIVVKDNGQGMSPDTVINSWMSPATDYKLRAKTSPKGRVYQGRKGIGRYAVSLLGNKLKLITVHDGIKTIAIFDWEEIENAEKLSEIEIDIIQDTTTENNSTTLIITNEKNEDGGYFRSELSEANVKTIEKEFSKLLFGQKDFTIYVTYDNFFENLEKNCKRKAIPEYKADEAYHYRLYGYVNEDFEYKFCFKNMYTNLEKEFEGNYFENLISKGKALNTPIVSCGNLIFDYKVYDKDSKGLDLIIDFLNSNVEELGKLSKRDARNLLKDNSGLAIFRNGFRIRPYGDVDYDWLGLNSRRVQNPSGAIGSEQLRGSIEVQNEEVSGLKEKSARDGLYENSNYTTLQLISLFALNILEKERINYRKKPAGKQPPIQTLFDFTEANTNIQKELEKTFEKIVASPSKKQDYLLKLTDYVSKEFKTLEVVNQDTYEEVKNEIAIYQQHATLGNVITVVLHEGRKPLSWIKNKIPRAKRKFLRATKDYPEIKDIYSPPFDILEELNSEATDLSEFFKKLDPMTPTKRSKMKEINLQKMLENVLGIFRSEAEKYNIIFNLTCAKEITVTMHEQDLYMAVTNLLENSVFWVQYSKEDKRVIDVVVSDYETTTIVNFLDNGPGISKEDIKSEVIFVPGYSGKENVENNNGTGLGLAIAGEALSRNNGKLEAVESENGAHFRIIIDKGTGEK
ncbi:ATP-binding protein [Lactococcus petauri]|nr:ATP-binding protein [Lactococcus petauri]